MSDNLSTQITQLQTDVATLTEDINKANTTIATFATDLAAALAAAQAGGATPEQLQALTDLHTSIVSASTSLENTMTANPLPADTTPPAAPAA